MNNKETILNCALQLFSEKGYEAVSVQELVNMANVTKPTLYYYFGSKEGVYDQLLLKNYSQLDEILAKTCIYEPKPESYFEDIYPVLTQVTISYFIFAREKPLFYRLVLSNLYMPTSSSVYDVMARYHFKQYDKILQLFLQMSKVHPNLADKERHFTWSFLGIINTYIALYLNDTPLSLSEDFAKQLVHQFMHGIYA
ncbi:TetR/AcrR family transcriptional regulator [Fusibacter ferrireducens]|uniref:TetR/AcrR family transcriptional regulator n=1 Tax=Fusibacter ferrireducens TaxID=2785058 RepID=A0ABR9ZQ84_9FIRM|nr:TetR/AcrR family transcriptional regulator [Fusibacter ferrireducens]MBF4692146.1 TetR/AcrR family transcriptional regulator [Fusibacter ferrireducens]